MRNKVCQGHVWGYTNSGSTDLAGGSLVTLGDCFVGVLFSDVAVGADGVAEVKGVFELPKDSAAIASGAALYLVSGVVTSTKPSSDVMYVGRAYDAAAATASVVPVKINFASPHVTETVTEST